MAYHDTETRKVRPANYKFLLDLCGEGSVLSEFDPNQEIEVVAIQGAVGDWAAYFETPFSREFRRPTQYAGNKLTQKLAEELFPEWKERLTWRY